MRAHVSDETFDEYEAHMGDLRERGLTGFGPLTSEPTFQVSARGLDAQEGRQFSEVYADALTDADLAGMSPATRKDAEAWQRSIAEAEHHPLDHEAAVHNEEAE
jgi:hypothetical protein